MIFLHEGCFGKSKSQEKWLLKTNIRLDVHVDSIASFIRTEIRRSVINQGISSLKKLNKTFSRNTVFAHRTETFSVRFCFLKYALSMVCAHDNK